MRKTKPIGIIFGTIMIGILGSFLFTLYLKICVEALFTGRYLWCLIPSMVFLAILFIIKLDEYLNGD